MILQVKSRRHNNIPPSPSNAGSTFITEFLICESSLILYNFTNQYYMLLSSLFILRSSSSNQLLGNMGQNSSNKTFPQILNCQHLNSRFMIGPVLQLLHVMMRFFQMCRYALGV